MALAPKDVLYVGGPSKPPNWGGLTVAFITSETTVVSFKLANQDMLKTGPYLEESWAL